MYFYVQLLNVLMVFLLILGTDMGFEHSTSRYKVIHLVVQCYVFIYVLSMHLLFSIHHKIVFFVVLLFGSLPFAVILMV